MKKNRLITVLFLLIGFLSSAQITLKTSTHVSAVGNATGIPSLTWNIPTGENRLMVVMIHIERDHRDPPFGDNYPGGTADNAPVLGIGTVTTFPTFINSGFWTNNANAYDWPIAEHTNSLMVYTLSDAGGLPTGPTTFNFSDITLPKKMADEISVTVLLYENVHSARFISYGGQHSITGINLFTLTGTAPTTPLGNGKADILYLSLFGGSFESTETSISETTGWTQKEWASVGNTAGTALTSASPFYSEPDGISTRVHQRNYASGNPSVTYTRSTAPSRIEGALAQIYALMPFAKPSISGTVYNDTNGLPDIDGNGTNAGGLYVNVIDAAGKLVYSAPVNSASPVGNFIVPQGYVLQGKTYRLELSKNTGTIGANAPIKELPSGWGTVGESISSSGNDGNHDGTISLTMGNFDRTGLRYGIKACTNSGANMVNLNSRYTGTLPTGVVLEWWTSPTRDLPPTSGTKVLNPTTVSVSGTYYAFFYDTANLCYNTNNSTAAVTVNILSPCPSSICTNPGDFTPGGTPTKMGITVQQKQEGWPTNIPNGFIALQSQNKGMVITRVAQVGGGTGGVPNLTTDSIKDPKEGMLVYDLAANCVKLFNGTIWKCLVKDCN